MHTVTLSDNQLYELNDAAHAVIERMLREGQDPVEIRLHALANLWSAYKVLQVTMTGSLDTPGLQSWEPQVMAAISKPKRRKAA